MKTETFKAINFIFKRMGKLFPCETHTEALEILHAWAEDHPLELAHQINHLVEMSIREYNWANNGKNPVAFRERADQNYEAYTSRIEEIMGLLGIEVVWPGLEPAYRKHGFTETTAYSALTRLLTKEDFLPIETEEG